MPNFSLYYGWKKSHGLVCLCVSFKHKDVALHFILKDGVKWGYSQMWYDGPIHEFTIWPFLMVCWYDT